MWGYRMRQQGLTIALESSREKIIARWMIGLPDLAATEHSIPRNDRIKRIDKDLYRLRSD